MTGRDREKGRRSHLIALAGSALCAPFIGIAFEKMVRQGWLGLDQVYAAYPITTIALAALVSIVPLALAVVWFVDEL